DLVLQLTRFGAVARGERDLRNVERMEAEGNLGAVERRDAAVDRVLPGEQVVVDRRPALLELAAEQVLDARARARRVVEHVLHLHVREQLPELRYHVVLARTEALGEPAIDFLLVPVVLLIAGL